MSCNAPNKKTTVGDTSMIATDSLDKAVLLTGLDTPNPGNIATHTNELMTSCDAKALVNDGLRRRSSRNKAYDGDVARRNENSCTVADCSAKASAQSSQGKGIDFAKQTYQKFPCLSSSSLLFSLRRDPLNLRNCRQWWPCLSALTRSSSLSAM